MIGRTAKKRSKLAILCTEKKPLKRGQLTNSVKGMTGETPCTKHHPQIGQPGKPWARSYPSAENCALKKMNIAGGGRIVPSTN